MIAAPPATAWRPRVGLVSSYFSLFDEQMPPDFRRRQEEAALGFRDALGTAAEVVYPGLVAGPEDASSCGAALRDANVDVVVLAPTMAAPPGHAATAIGGLECPIVVWNAPGAERLADDLDQATAHEHTTLVSAIMLGNALGRQGRRPVAVTARPDRADELDGLLATVRGCAAGASLRGTVALRVGEPIEGYVDVEAAPDDLAALGVTECAVTRDELRDAFESGELAPVDAELAMRGFGGDPDERSRRLAAALWTLVVRSGASCGTVNCHGTFLRDDPLIGIAACLGMSLCTSRGVPFSCTGDLPTALALLLGQRLAGAALYCELFASDLARELVLVSNGGEGDAGWAAGPVLIAPSTHYPGRHGAGAAVAFDLRPGPATLLSLSPAPGGWRCVWTVGEILASPHPRMGAPHGLLRFHGERPFTATLDAWIASGATHHNALLPGDRSAELRSAAQALGMEASHV